MDHILIIVGFVVLVLWVIGNAVGDVLGQQERERRAERADELVQRQLKEEDDGAQDQRPDARTG